MQSTVNHAQATCDSQLLNHDFTALVSGETINLCEAYQGKVILAVNTASQCGFTSQYRGLQEISDKYSDQGLVVLGFPSNDFFQERGSNEDIAEFCELNYNIKFTMFEKTPVRGKDANPFYQQLSEATGSSPKWNFFKYLIGRDGQVIDSFGSSVKPTGKKLTEAIESALAKPDQMASK